MVVECPNLCWNGHVSRRDGNGAFYGVKRCDCCRGEGTVVLSPGETSKSYFDRWESTVKSSV